MAPPQTPPLWGGEYPSPKPTPFCVFRDTPIILNTPISGSACRNPWCCLVELIQLYSVINWVHLMRVCCDRRWGMWQHNVRVTSRRLQWRSRAARDVTQGRNSFPWSPRSARIQSLTQRYTAVGIYLFYLFNSSIHINNKNIKTYDSSPQCGLNGQHRVMPLTCGRNRPTNKNDAIFKSTQ